MTNSRHQDRRAVQAHVRAGSTLKEAKRHDLEAKRSLRRVLGPSAKRIARELKWVEHRRDQLSDRAIALLKKVVGARPMRLEEAWA